jgi:hypothetical protein
MNVTIAYVTCWDIAQEYLKEYGDFDIEWEEMARLGNSMKPFMYITKDRKNKFVFFTSQNIQNWYKEVSPVDHVSYVFLSSMRATYDYIKLYEVFLPILYTYQQSEEINYRNCRIWSPIKKHYRIINILRSLNEHKTNMIKEHFKNEYEMSEDHKVNNLIKFHAKESHQK